MTSENRPVLYLIFGVTLTGILSNSLLAPAIPNILEEFGRDNSAAGVLVAAGSLPGIVVAPLIGILADRYGRRNVLVPCLLIFGIFGLAAASAPTYEMLLLARFAMGFGSAGMINLAVVLIGDYFPAEDRTKIIGRNSSVLTVGLAIVPLSSGLITDLAGWRWAMGLYSIALATGFMAFMVLDGGRPTPTGTIREQLGGAGIALRNRRILTTLLVGILLFALVFGIFLTTLPNHLESEFGLSAAWRGVIIALPALPSTLVAFNLGKIQDRFGLGPTLLATSLSWAGAFALIAAAPVLGVVVLGALFYGAGEGALIPSLQSVAMDTAPPEHRGAVMAVWVGSARLGQTGGPLAAGALLSSYTTSTVIWVGCGLALVMVGLFAISPLVRED